MRKYDTTYVIDGTLGADDCEALIEKFSSSLEKKGGKIEQTVRWGIRTLSYEINKRSRGYYVILYYSAEPSVIKAFERELRINENVLRFMTLVFDGEHPSYIVDEGRRGRESSYHKPQEEKIPEIDEDIEVQENIEDIEESDENQDELGVEKEVDENDFPDKDSDEVEKETASESTNFDNEDKTDDVDDVDNVDDNVIDKENE